MFGLSLRTKITLAGVVSLAGVVALAFVGYTTVNRVLDLTQLDMVNKLVQKHMENDMVHDAINGDVITVLGAVSKKDTAMIATIQTDVKDHISTLHENLEGLNALELPNHIRELMTPLAATLKAYGEAAQKVVDAAERDHTTGSNDAAALEAPFRTLFKDIEGKMGAASDAIDAWSGAIKEQGIHSAQAGGKQLRMIALASVLFALFVPIYMYLALFRPQRKLITVADQLLRNQFDVEVPYTRRRDEIGAFSTLLLAMQRSGMEKGRVAEQFERKVKSIVDIVASAATEMGASASGVAANIQDNTQKLAELNSNMQRTSNNIQAVASAVEQLSASGSEIRQQVVQSGKINSSAVEQSKEVNSVSEELSQSVQTIGDITKVIATITNQINLLSLNATIEAARAGDAGKGFAVVASEVKTLANQTSKSTGDISSQINIVQEAATKALDGMKNISNVIQEIDHVSATIAAAIEEQGQATESISRNIEEAARYSNTIAEHVQSVSKMAERTGSDANEMQKASADLARQAENLRREVDEFLNSIRKEAA